MILWQSPPDDKVVVFGMSCSGKTKFALEFDDHHYSCFDALFPWHLIETLGLSIDENLRFISDHFFVEEKCVLDGWHLSDKDGDILPDCARVYVVYAPYEQIIDQYRVPVQDRDQHRPMFRKWYHEINYPSFKSRYFLNEGHFKETTEDEFLTFLEHNQ